MCIRSFRLQPSLRGILGSHKDALEGLPGDYPGIAPLCVGIVLALAPLAPLLDSKGEQAR